MVGLAGLPSHGRRWHWEKDLETLSLKNTKLEEDVRQLRLRLSRQGPGSPRDNNCADEIDRLMGELVGSKMELAELKEECIVLKNDLIKSKEISMRMAAKMTRMETMLYSYQTQGTNNSQSRSSVRSKTPSGDNS